MGGGSKEVAETELEKTTAKIAMNKFDTYLDKYRPAENQFMSKVERLNSSNQQYQAGVLAKRSVSSEFGKAVINNAKQMSTMSINPNSAKFKGVLSRTARKGASAELDTTARVQASQSDRYIAGKKSVVAMGQGKEAEAISGLSDVASTSGAYARQSAANEQFNTNMVGEVAGSAIGAGMAYYGNKKDIPDHTN